LGQLLFLCNKSFILTSKFNQKKPFTILGVDPGTQYTGYGIIEVYRKELRLLDSGVINLTGMETHQEKILSIFKNINFEIQSYKPIAMAVEAPFYGKNVQSMLKLGRAQGAAIVAAMSCNIEVTEYSPKKIKQSITGNGNASKEQVCAMLSSILKVSLEGQPLDATDALGAAVCHYYQASSPLAGLKGGSWASFIKNNPGKIKKV